MRGRLLPLLLLAACAADEDPSDNPIDQLISNLEKLPTMEEHRTEGTPSAAIADGDYECVETPVSEVRNYDQMLGQLGTGDVQWPGAMLRGDSAYSGSLIPLVFDRAPVTFSVSLENLGGGQRSATLPSPSLSSYRDELGKILAQDLNGTVPARIVSEITEVSSEQQLAVALGASASAPLVGSVKAGFNFSDTTKRTRFLVKYFQIYYSVDVDPPGLPHKFFAPHVTAEEIAAAVSNESPPLYVSSIEYGRQVVFTFESDLAKSEVSAALEFAYNGGPPIEGNVSLTHSEVIANTRTTAFILGGDGTRAAQAVSNLEQLMEFINEGGNYTNDSRGAVISYKLAYVRDHSPAKISYASDYVQRTCSRVSQNVRVRFTKMSVPQGGGGDDGGELEVFGHLHATGADGVAHPLFDKSQDTRVTIPVLGQYPSVGFNAQPIVKVKPQPGNRILITGSLFEYDLLGNDTFSTLPFQLSYENGWRRQVLYPVNAGGGQAMTLQLDLEPIP